MGRRLTEAEPAPVVVERSGIRRADTNRICTLPIPTEMQWHDACTPFTAKCFRGAVDYLPRVQAAFSLTPPACCSLPCCWRRRP